MPCVGLPVSGIAAVAATPQLLNRMFPKSPCATGWISAEGHYYDRLATV